MELSGRQLISAAALGAGALAVVAGLALLFFRELRSEPADTTRAPGARRPEVLPLAVLLLIVLAGSWLRLDGLVAKTLSHTEAIIPNIQWPPDTWPPTRTSFYETFWWHYHGEGHPQAHYFLMWAWTKLFGTGLFSLRLPSALFGIASIPLVYAVGSRAWSRRVGLLAAALLSLNGLHIYFSQYSRMFMMACCLALLSTWLLLQAVRSPGRRVPWEVAYVLVTWLAIYTLTFVWTILAAQMLWVVLQRRGSGALARRVLALQALVVMLGAPSLAHILYRGDDVDLPGPSLMFLAEYLSFGFVLEPDEWSIPPRAPAPALAAAVLGLGLLLGGAGLAARGRALPVRRDPGRLPLPPRLVIALGAALVTAGLVVVALRHQAIIAPIILVPFLALAIPPAGGWLRDRVALPVRTGADAAAPEWSGKSIVVLLALVPPLIIVALSFWTSMLTSRAFLVFVPFLLIVVSAGAWQLVGLGAGAPATPGRRAAAVVVAGVLLAIHVASVVHWRRHPNEQFDYAALARQMAPRIQPGDLVFVHADLWVVTPLLYYLDDGPHSYVMHDFAAAVAERPDARVWLLHFDSYQWGEYRTTTPEMLSAVSGYRPAERVAALRARAELLVPPARVSASSP
jgi:4-amino-4-deoxy-L-arabinose transferase-like glycosyltransferase